MNETKTERELQVQYKEREIAGKLACMKRLQSMEQQTLRDKIQKLKDNLEIEGKVSKKIQSFIGAKKSQIITKYEALDQKRENCNKKIAEDKEDIELKKEEANEEMNEMQKKVEEQNEERRKQEILDEENAAEERRHLQEKIDMDIAAKYIQKKWNWY